MKHTYLGLIACLIWNCSKEDTNDIVAKVGFCNLTTYEFISSYSQKLLSNTVQDSKFERERHLAQLIKNSLFADAAIRDGLQLDTISNYVFKLDSIKIIRQGLHSRIKKSNKIKVNQQLIKKHYKWMNRECEIRHLFFQDSLNAFDTFQKVKSGIEKFESVAESIFKNDVLKSNGGYLGWIVYNDLDPNLEKHIFDAPINILIGPIRSSYGWHIVEKLDERNQIFIDSVEYKLKKQSIVENIIKKNQQIGSDQYVNNLMLKKNISIDDTLVNFATQMILIITNSDIKHSEKELRLNSEKRILFGISKLKEMANETLATYDDGSFSIQDLIDGAKSLNIQKYKSSPENIFYKSLRNKILFEEGLKNRVQYEREIKLRLRDKKEDLYSRIYLDTYFWNKSENYFPKAIYNNLADSLRTISKPEIYWHTFDSIFKNKLDIKTL